MINLIEYLSDRVEEGSLLTVLQAVQARLEAWCAVALAEVRMADACNSSGLQETSTNKGYTEFLTGDD